MGLRDKLTIMQEVSMGSVIRGLVISYVLIIILSLILSLIFYLSPLSELWMKPFGVVTAALALFCGGYGAGRSAGTKGLYHGLFVGILFILLMAVTSLASGISWSSFIVKSAYSLLAAAIGGISGVK
ncbi:MAG: TIGR04086 family membrane protein [Desulfitobacteriaceae bacterium]|nr:TIGR04086 family membrane protein [Desulfitobacteriaceae bacterium]MDD4752193.1 TIGR04086 family membrane protein [Desulfitobacteriaceae bacterium]